MTLTTKRPLSGSEYHKLQRLELVPQRWPLARLSISLQKCVDHLDRVLAGCCSTVKKVRNSLTWFSHGSGASLAPEPLVRVPFSTTRVFETLFSLN